MIHVNEGCRFEDGPIVFGKLMSLTGERLTGIYLKIRLPQIMSQEIVSPHNFTTSTWPSKKHVMFRLRADCPWKKMKIKMYSVWLPVNNTLW